jgi:hypothetical protein
MRMNCEDQPAEMPAAAAVAVAGDTAANSHISNQEVRESGMDEDSISCRGEETFFPAVLESFAWKMCTRHGTIMFVQLTSMSWQHLWES